MSAILALNAARDAGVRFRLDNDNLILDADDEPRGTLLDTLVCHREGIVALLRVGADDWSGEDLLACFDERAAIAEYDGGLSRSEAEQQAFSDCIAELQRSDLSASVPGRCVHCGGGETEAEKIRLLGDEQAGRRNVHPSCLLPWQASRRDRAEEMLSGLGIKRRRAP